MQNNPFSLKHKNILVTGASSGIGKSIAIACANLGANVILVARDPARLEETYNELPEGKHAVFSVDLTNYEQLEPIVSKYVCESGKIDGFVHAAGIEMTLPLQFTKPQDYEKIFAVNFISGFEMGKILSKKKYVNPSGGSFVYIASVRGILGHEAAIAYCSSKGAVIAGVKAMALELASKNIRVNSILPSIVETEMTKKYFESIPPESQNAIRGMHPLGLGKPEDVAYACIFLLSDASRWITGSNMMVDGGYSSK